MSFIPCCDDGCSLLGACHGEVSYLYYYYYLFAPNCNHLYGCYLMVSEYVESKTFSVYLDTMVREGSNFQFFYFSKRFGEKEAQKSEMQV